MKYQLIRGDCLVEMKKIDDASIDLILCDLPYGTTDQYSDSNENRVFDWDMVIPLDLLWEQYKRILKPKGTVVLTADQPFTSQLVISNYEWFKYEWIWVKEKVIGFLLANYRPMKQTEDILVFSPAGASAGSAKSGNSMTYNPQGLIPKRVKKRNNPKRLGVVIHNPDHLGSGNKLLTDSEYEQKFTNYPSEIINCSLDDERVHPTQKPVALMEYLIRTHSNEDDLVLDNCMGSGTTGVACGRTGRRFVGIEQNQEFFTIAEERIKDSYFNLETMFGGDK
tara:strand:- start:17621 stop:18460 length:840 start_codon:yes stop_codon:yes gene_type:complete